MPFGKKQSLLHRLPFPLCNLPSDLLQQAQTLDKCHRWFTQLSPKIWPVDGQFNSTQTSTTRTSINGVNNNKSGIRNGLKRRQDARQHRRRGHGGGTAGARRGHGGALQGNHHTHRHSYVRRIGGPHHREKTVALQNKETNFLFSFSRVYWRASRSTPVAPFQLFTQ